MLEDEKRPVGLPQKIKHKKYARQTRCADSSKKGVQLSLQTSFMLVLVRLDDIGAK